MQAIIVPAAAMGTTNVQQHTCGIGNAVMQSNNSSSNSNGNVHVYKVNVMLEQYCILS